MGATVEYVWTNDLSVGHAHIDADHKHLYELVNTLFQAMRAGKANAVLGAILDELVDYTGTHFSREEALMQQVHFPGYAEHKSAHDALVKEVRALQMRFKGGSITLSLDVFKFLSDWLRNHIMTYDVQLGAAVQK